MKILLPVELNSTKSIVLFMVESTEIFLNSTNDKLNFIKTIIRRI